jgi:hypothetical protein
MRKYEGQLEEEEEQDQVEGDEAPHAGRLEQQHPGDEGPGVAPGPGPQHGEREEHGRQHHQEEGDAVDPERPVDAETGGPGVVAHHLVAADPGLEGEQHGGGHGQGDHGHDDAQRLVEPGGHGLLGHDRHQGGTHRGHQDQRGQVGEGHRGHQPHHILVSMNPRITTAPNMMPTR